jgi:adenosylmethionine-8-amino-7-oxononanoate aminotransferase
MAANATLDIFENEHILERNRVKIDILAALLERFEALPNVLETRQRGMIAAVELKGYEPHERIGLKIYRYALEKGVLLRPLGNVVYFMPPYIVTEEQMIRMTDVAYEAIREIAS